MFIVQFFEDAETFL